MEGSPCDSQAGGVELEDDGSPWLAAYTRPRHEHKVRKFCQERSIEAFLPTHYSWRCWSDRKKLLEVPLFPSYVFVKPGERQRHRVVQAPGFLWFIHNSSGPTPVDRAELMSLRRALQGGLRVDPLPGVAVGDEVEITAGALCGYRGQLACKDGRELVLRVSVIHATVRVRLPDPSWVRPVSHPRSNAAVMA